MFKKLKTIKNLAILFGALFIIFVIASNVFLIVTNIKLDQRLDDMTREWNSYCKNLDID